MNNWILSTQTGHSPAAGNITRKWQGRDLDFSLWCHDNILWMWGRLKSGFISSLQFLFRVLWLPPTLRVYVDNFCVSMWWKDLQNHISYISLQPNRPCKNILFLWEAKTLEWKERRALWGFYFLKFVSSLHSALMSANSEIMIKHIRQMRQDCKKTPIISRM